MNQACAELAKVPLRPDAQQQIQTLKNAKKRLEGELEEAKANSQLRRYKMLQNDLQAHNSTPLAINTLPLWVSLPP